MTLEPKALNSFYFSFFFVEEVQLCRTFDSKSLLRPMQWLPLSLVRLLSLGSRATARIVPLLLTDPDRPRGMTSKRSFP
jgi:hypothetical protein